MKKSKNYCWNKWQAKIPSVQSVPWQIYRRPATAMAMEMETTQLSPTSPVLAVLTNRF